MNSSLPNRLGDGFGSLVFSSVRSPPLLSSPLPHFPRTRNHFVRLSSSVPFPPPSLKVEDARERVKANAEQERLHDLETIRLNQEMSALWHNPIAVIFPSPPSALRAPIPFSLQAAPGDPRRICAPPRATADHGGGARASDAQPGAPHNACLLLRTRR